MSKLQHDGLALEGDFVRRFQFYDKANYRQRCRWLFINLSFLDASDMLNRMTKQSRDWHTRDFVMASPTILGGVTAK